MQSRERDTIVIIGAGFAGLNLAKNLDKNKFNVIVVDRNNFHSFPPLFYQIASSGLDPSNISFPLRREFKRNSSVTYRMGHVKNVDVYAQNITTSYETIKYDKLVIAAGSTNNFFGIQELDHKVFGIKTVGEAIYTRYEILDRLERGAICQDSKRRKELLSFLVVGGGASGVEIAGALGEMKRDILPREYPELNPDDMRITIVEGFSKLLGSMSEKASARALKDLRDLMVEVRLNTVLRSYDDKIVTFEDGSREYWETLVWTAGITGEPIPGLSKEFIGGGGRIIVDEYNKVKGIDNVYAIGDIAFMETDEYPHGHPQVAQAAIQQGENLAKNLNKGKGRNLKPFRYKDKGSMATIGKNHAVVDMGKTFLQGRVAWWVWMFVHLISIVGVRNKLNVLLNWSWNYFTYSTSLRLLLRPVKYPLRKHWGD